MTVTSTTARSGPYAGNGSTTQFAYTFRILDEAHLTVVKTAADGTETTLTVDVDYVVSDVGNPAGGTVATTVPPASGETLTILRGVPLTQETDWTNQGPFFAETVEEAVDKLTMIAQQFDERVDRTLILPEASTITNLELPAPSADQILGWNGAATALENKTPNTATYLTVPGSATDNRVVRMDGATGTAFQESVVTIDDSGNVDGGATITLDIADTGHEERIVVQRGGTTVGAVGVDTDGRLTFFGGSGLTEGHLSLTSDGKLRADYSQDAGTLPGGVYRARPQTYLKNDLWVTGVCRVGRPDVYESDDRSVTSLTRSGSTATVTTGAAHGWTVGADVWIDGADQSEYNGNTVITAVPSSTTFEFTVPGTPATPATGTIVVRQITLLDPNGALNVGRGLAAQNLAMIQIYRSDGAFDLGERARLGLDANDSFTIFAGSSNYNLAIFNQAKAVGFNTDATGVDLFIPWAQTASFAADIIQVRCDRAATTNFDFLTTRSSASGTPDIEHRLDGAGNIQFDGSTGSPAADYAEMFEWSDRNPKGEDRVGLTVVLDGEKIRPASREDAAHKIIGVISGRPAVVGDAAPLRWKNKHLRDEWGRYKTIPVERWVWTEVVDEVDGDGIRTKTPRTRERLVSEGREGVPDDAERVTTDERQLNPDWDPDQAYVPRAERSEWDPVGLVGKLWVRKGQPVGDRWIRLAEAGTAERWLVR